VSVRTKELERLLVSVEDSEVFMDLHNLHHKTITVCCWSETRLFGVHLFCSFRATSVAWINETANASFLR
jgi:hypothetical protein